MPFVPKGDVRHVGVVLRRCARRRSAARWRSAVIANPSEVTLTGKITTFTDAAGVAAVSAPFEVPPRGTTVFDLAQMQPQGTFVSAMVEIYGGGGFVEQRADSASGSAVSPCSNSTSSTWYFADGYTVEGSKEHLVVTNPFPSDAIVSISESTGTESRQSGDPAEPAREGQLGAGHQPGSARQARTGPGDHRHEHPRPGRRRPRPGVPRPRSAAPASR